MDMQSLPSVEQVNLESYWDVVRKLDPELFLVKVALQETGVNPVLLPRVIRALSNLAIGSGYGKIQIFMERGIITQMKPEESDQINQPALCG